MRTRFLKLIAVIFLMPFAALCLVLALPVWLFTGKVTLDSWLGPYSDFITGPAEIIDLHQVSKMPPPSKRKLIGYTKGVGKLFPPQAIYQDDTDYKKAQVDTHV